MKPDEQHVALPKLYGAPAYARPTGAVEVTPRPFDPDDLPIEAVQLFDELDLATPLPDRGDAPGVSQEVGRAAYSPNEPCLRPQPLRLKAFAGRILGNGEA